MSFLTSQRREDLVNLAKELGEDPDPDLRVPGLKKLILGSSNYEEEDVKNMLEVITQLRKDNELEEKQRQRELKDFAEKEKERERKERFELQELERLRLQTQMNEQPRPTIEVITPEFSKLDLKHLIPKFKPDEDISLFLTLFERQIKMLQVPEHLYVNYLISSLPSDVSMLIAREDETKASDYTFVKSLLLQRFKLNAEKFRQLFSYTRKDTNETWKDFFFKLNSYLDGWLSELKITSFEILKELIITDQMKKRCPPEIKEHYLDEWSDFVSPKQLAEKLDLYESLRNCQFPKNFSKEHQFKIPFNQGEKHLAQSKRYSQTQQIIHENRKDQLGLPGIPSKSRRDPGIPSKSRREPSSYGRPIPDVQESNLNLCYGCGLPGYIRRNCPNCSSEKKPVHSRSEQMYTCQTTCQPIALIGLTILGERAKICADTGASRSIAGERLYKMLLSKGVKFLTESVTMTLADGRQSTFNAYTATVPIEVERIVINTRLMVIPHAKSNRSLLGQDFLEEAGIVLDLQKRRWNFSNSPLDYFDFRKAEDQAMVNGLPVAMNKTEGDLEINSSEKQKVSPSLVASTSALRSDEGEFLTPCQRKSMNELFEKYEPIFRPGGDPTPFIEHRINTGNHSPVAVPPYRMNPARKESLKKERVEEEQDRRKKYADKRRRSGPRYVPGDHVWVNLHPLSKASKKFTATFAPKRDGPYVIRTQKSFSTYEVASLENPDIPIGTYHTSALTPCPARDIPHQPVLPLRKRGRPKKNSTNFSVDPGPSSGRLRDQRGSVAAGNPSTPRN